MQPNNPLYNILRAVRIHGLLNIEALEQSFNEIVRRHEILRTTFVTVDDQPVQVIIRLFRWSCLCRHQATPEDERETEAQRLSFEEARTPFDLSRGPLLRAQLLRLGAEEHVCC